MRKRVLFTCSAIALGAVIATTATPAQAQAVCEIAGAAGS